MPEQPIELTQYSFTRGGAQILQSVLVTAGWTKSRKDVTIAGFLADELETSIGQRAIFDGATRPNGDPVDVPAFGKFKEQINAWDKDLFTLSLSDRQFQTCQTCLKFYTDEGKIPSSIHASKLLTVFKLTE